MTIRHLLTTCAASMLLPALASAGVIINSIQVETVSSTYDARRFNGSSEDAFAAAQTAFNRAAPACSKSLQALTGVSHRGICEGASGRDFAARYTITGSVRGPAIFEFGLDWGRGGFIAGTSGINAPLVYLNEDIWWNGNWNHEDVKGRGRQAAASIVIPASDSFTLTLLGFEGCCDGINSGRYQSLAHGLTPFLRSETGADPFGVESSTGGMGNRGRSDPFSPLAFDASIAGIVADPEGWTALAVNAVPAPASLPLFGLGAALLVFGRRRRDARGIR